MKKLEQEEINKKGKNHPLLKGLPTELKDIDSFDRIEKALTKAVFSDHTHSTVKGFTSCKRCRAKLERQQQLKKEFGFKSQDQYLLWKRIMSIIKNKASFEL